MTFFGLPLHPLVVHATVVVVPLAALSVLVAAFNSRFRGWAGPVPMLLSAMGLILAPLSSSTGEDLQAAVGTPAFDHAELGDTLVWVMIPLTVLAAVAWFLHRRGADQARLAGIAGVLAALIALGALVDTALIGHSGASAAWCGKNPQFVQCQPAGGGAAESDD